MSYEPNETLSLQIPIPAEELEFSGERCTSAVQGAIRQEHLHRYFFALQFCEDKDVLDVASGEGYGAALMSQIARSVTGIDISQEAVAHAARNYSVPRYIVSLAESLPLSDASVDIVVSFETIEHLTDHSAFLREIKRVLKPNGILVMSSPDRDIYSGKQGIRNPHHLKELSKREFDVLMREYFANTRLFGQTSMTGSVIAPDGGSTGELHVQGFRQITTNFIEAAPGIPSPTYIISVATNGTMPEIFTGCFDDRPFQLGLYDELEKRNVRIAQSESEIEKLRARLKASHQLAAEVAALEKQLAVKEAEIHNRLEAIGREKALVRSLETQLLAERSSATKSAAEAAHHAEIERHSSAALLTKYMAVKAQLDALRASKSWQLLQPLRDLAAAKSSFARNHSAGASSRLATAICSFRQRKTVNLLRRSGLFDGTYYLEQNLDLAATQVDPLLHYVMNGANEGRNPHLLFDSFFYLNQNPDLAQADVNPLAHYLEVGSKEGRNPHPLFDTGYYLQQNPDVAQSGVNLLAHYLEAGWRERRNPHPLFDTSYYLDNNPDVAQSGIDPLSHYLRGGWREYRDPHSLFKISYYLGNNPDAGESGIDPLSHYLRYGWRKRNNPHPLFDVSYFLSKNPDLGTEVEPLTYYVQHGSTEARNPHPLFHNEYYREQNAGIPAEGISLLAHYIEVGWREGRNPHPLFNTAYYLQRNPDIAQLGSNPLVHYLEVGWKERNAHPLFDTAYYLECNPDISQSGVNPLVHYLEVGWKEGRNPHPLFDVAFYLDSKPDTTQPDIDPLSHYLRYGWKEGRNPHPLFDAAYYLSRNPDIPRSGVNPLIHYLEGGWKEGRNPHPLFDVFFYLEGNPDATQSGIDPLSHYLRYGWREHRNPHPLFDVSFVLTNNPDLGTEIEPLAHYVRYGATAGFNPHPLFHSEYYLEKNPAAAGSNPLIFYLEDGWKQEGNPHPLFDARYYLQQNPDVAQSGVNPLTHYLKIGWKEHRNPYLIFDVSYYLENNPDIAESNIDPLSHYLRYGWRERRNPHPLFDISYLLAENPDFGTEIEPLAHYAQYVTTEGRKTHPLFHPRYYLERNPDVVAAHLDPLVHYLESGWNERRSTHPLFDVSFYLGNNPAAAQSGVDPVSQYLRYGWKEGHNPHPLFDAAYYLQQNPDIAQAIVNPLAHYLEVGWKEGRNPHPLFNTSYYLEHNPDAVQSGFDPLSHYLRYGWKEGHNPHPLFDVSYVLATNPDLGTETEPLMHYMRRGAIEGRNPHPLFYSRYYLEQNLDVAAAGANPLAHYCGCGFREGRNPNPLFDSRYYVETNSNLNWETNALAHFVTQGAADRRSPHPLFNTAFYSERNPDVAAAGVNLLEHFLSTGFAEDRDPHPLFDLSFYIQRSPRILQTRQNPVIHYLTNGAREGKDPHPHFDTNYYLDTYPDVRYSGVNPLVHFITYGRDHGYEPNSYYKTFLNPTSDFEFPTAPIEILQQQKPHPLHYRPLISVVMPTYNSPPKYLHLAIRSIQQQMYANWELCICDDGSFSEATLELLRREAERDSRIHLQCNSRNGGISHATNQAMSMAQGEFVAFMDHDDELTKDALFEIVSAINTHSDADALYSDQDFINDDGSLDQPFFKPDWSPDFFRGVMYVGHLLVVRRTLALETGFDSQFDFVQDFEFMLRLSERTQKIVHVPRVLYHWRRIQGSVAFHSDEKPGIETLQAEAVNAHLKRCGIPAVATSNPSHPHRLLICPELHGPAPTVTILLDMRGQLSDSARSVSSILDQTTYNPFEIGLIGAAEPSANAASLPFRVLGNTFSSALEKVQSEFVVLVRPAIEILSSDWLNHLLLYAEQPGIACVGPLILRPDGKVSNAGLIVTGFAETRMAMHGFPPNSDGYAGSLSCAREVAALDDACVMVETRKLRQFSILEEYETTPYQIIDVCLRAAKSGMRNICNPRAAVKLFCQSIHERVPVFDRVLFQNVWAYEAPRHDPYYNPNFGSSDFGVAKATSIRS
ncbi:MAG TPA: glycosyltransferase [Bryobacteraceae bacterium]|nr:glycosyltransferase [Bryobacteraceae bacterium]